MAAKISLGLTLQALWVDCEDPAASGWSLLASAGDGVSRCVGDIEMPFGRDAAPAEVAAYVREHVEIEVEVDERGAA